MGVARRADSGNWKAEVFHEGRKVCSKTFPARELAQAWHDTRRVELLRGEAGIKPRTAALTLRELATRYLAAIEPQARPDTFRYYRARLGCHIVPALGDRRLPELTRAVVTNYLTARLQAGMSAASYGKELQILKRLLNWAMDQELMDANPIMRLRALRAPKQAEARFYTPEEVAGILAPLNGSTLGLMLTAFRTGMRRRELAGFRLEWCDFDRDIVRIPNTVDFSTKSHKARTVPLADDLKAWLLSLNRRTGPAFLSDRTPQRPIVGFRRRLERIERLTGEAIKLHNCRHTYASFLVACGVPLAEVQAALGHANITTTMIYAHLSPDYLANVRAALARTSGRGGLTGRSLRPGRELVTPLSPHEGSDEAESQHQQSVF